MVPRHVPNDMTNWLQDSQAEDQDALVRGDCTNLIELGKPLPEGVNQLMEMTTVPPSSVANMVVT